jgi:hypothetical protein
LYKQTNNYIRIYYIYQMRAQRKTLTKRANKKGTKKRRSRRYKQQGGAEGAKAAVASLANAAAAAAEELNKKAVKAGSAEAGAEESELTEAGSRGSEESGSGDCDEAYAAREAAFKNLQNELEESQQKVTDLQAMMKESHSVFSGIMDEYQKGLLLLAQKLAAKDNADSLDNADSPGRRDSNLGRGRRDNNLGRGRRDSSLGSLGEVAVDAADRVTSMLSRLGGGTELRNVSPPTREPSPQPANHPRTRGGSQSRPENRS